jgi:hypothetical protein
VGVEEWPAWLAHGEFDDGGSAPALPADASHLRSQPIVTGLPSKERMIKQRFPPLSFPLLLPLLANRVVPLQLRKSGKISVRALECQSVLNRQRGKMSVRDEIR